MWRTSRYFALLYWIAALLSAALVGVWANVPLPLQTVAVQDQRVRAAALVYGDQSVSQVVAVPRSGLSAIAFWLLNHQRDAPGTITLRVTTPEQPADTLALVSLPFAALPTQQPVRFDLPTFTQAATPVLVFTLQSTDLDRAHALSVLGGDNTYGQGLMLVNGTMRPAEDLAFRAFVGERQGDTILPLSRMAQGRPGLFGQPAFYATIVWIGLWAYLWAALLLLRWAIDQRSQRAVATSRYVTRRLTDW